MARFATPNDVLWLHRAIDEPKLIDLKTGLVSILRPGTKVVLAGPLPLAYRGANYDPARPRCSATANGNGWLVLEENGYRVLIETLDPRIQILVVRSTKEPCMPVPDEVFAARRRAA